MASFETVSSTVEQLIAGNSHLLVSRNITLKSGQNLQRGAVIGKDGGDKYLLSLSAAADGSETPDLVLADACDASAADTPAIAYERGDFLESGLTIGTGHTAGSIREGLRDKGITLIKGA